MSRNPLLEPPPTRIALSGDWHRNADFAKRAIASAAAQGAQGIIQLGDFGIWPGHVGRAYLTSVSQQLEKAGIWGCFIDGNHDDFWQLHSIPLDPNGLRPIRDNLWHIPRGYRWWWNERTWLALGGAVSMDRKLRTIGKNWWPEETITNSQFEEVLAGGPADVMLTHDCPSGVDIPGLMPEGFWDADQMRNANAHRQILRAVVDDVAPTTLYHGHFHVRYQAIAEFERSRCLIEGLGDDGCGLSESLIMVDV